MAMAVRPLRPLVRVALPVAIAAILVCLAVVNVALVKTWPGELEDGVLWAREGSNVVAAEVADGTAGARAGIVPRDVLLLVDGREVQAPADVARMLKAAPAAAHEYVVKHAAVERPVVVRHEL
jgi:membrane-associated protease RseP (regulator of RpoE activity)